VQVARVEVALGAIPALIVELTLLQTQEVAVEAHLLRDIALSHLTHLAQVVLALSLFATNQQLSVALVER